MNKTNTLCVNPCKLDEIAERVSAVHATLDLIHAAMTDDAASRALYGLMFSLDNIKESVEALIETGEKVTA